MPESDDTRRPDDATGPDDTQARDEQRPAADADHTEQTEQTDNSSEPQASDSETDESTPQGEPSSEPSDRPESSETPSGESGDRPSEGEPAGPEATPGVPEAAEAAQKARKLAEDLVSDLELDRPEPEAMPEEAPPAASEVIGADEQAEGQAPEVLEGGVGAETAEADTEAIAAEVEGAEGAGPDAAELEAERKAVHSEEDQSQQAATGEEPALAVEEPSEAETGHAEESAEAAESTDAAPEGEAADTESTEAESEQAQEPEPARPIPEGLTLDDVVESLIMVATGPIPSQKIAKVLSPEQIKPTEVREAVRRLNELYAETARMFRIEEIAGGYQMYTVPEVAEFVSRQTSGGQQEVRLSQAALEVLAIVAYKQPIIRADIEAIRGVACGPVLRHLMDVGLVRIAGRSEQLGRPMLYGTTKKFLQHFGLADLKDLPKTGTLVLPSERQEKKEEPETATQQEHQTANDIDN